MSSSVNGINTYCIGCGAKSDIAYCSTLCNELHLNFNIRALATGQVLIDEVISGTIYSVEDPANQQTLFYGILEKFQYAKTKVGPSRASALDDLLDMSGIPAIVVFPQDTAIL